MAIIKLLVTTLYNIFKNGWQCYIKIVTLDSIRYDIIKLRIHTPT